MSPLRVGVAFSPDPLYISPFVCRLLEQYGDSIELVICTKGSILKRRSLSEELAYLTALLIILGPVTYVQNMRRMLFGRRRAQERIRALCRSRGIHLIEVDSVNSDAAVGALRALDIDLLLNQSQHIVRKNVLDAVKKDVFNRHGALLPTYRGRLAPFWQLYNKEEFGGLTYHVVDEQIDNGPIIFQVAIPIADDESFATLTRKVFDLAVTHFGTVLEFYERSDYRSFYQPNDASKKTYFGSPGISDALRYRLRRR